MIEKQEQIDIYSTAPCPLVHAYHGMFLKPPEDGRKWVVNATQHTDTLVVHSVYEPSSVLLCK